LGIVARLLDERGSGCRGKIGGVCELGLLPRLTVLVGLGGLTGKRDNLAEAEEGIRAGTMVGDVGVGDMGLLLTGLATLTGEGGKLVETKVGDVGVAIWDCC